jgi:hypothetical protein
MGVKVVNKAVSKATYVAWNISNNQERSGAASSGGSRSARQRTRA